MNNKTGSVTKNDEEFDIKKIFSSFLFYWKLYLLSIGVLLLLSFLFIRYSTPLYKVHAQVLVQDDQDKGASSFMQSGMSPDFSGLFSMQSNVKNELAILQTRDLLKKVVLKMHLNVAYYRKGDIRDVELYTRSPFKIDFFPVSDSILLFQFELNFPDSGKSSGFTISGVNNSFKTKGNFGDILNSPAGKFRVTRSGQPFQTDAYLCSFNSVAAVLADITKNLIISIPDEETTVIQLDYNTGTPKKGEALVGKLIEEYINRNLSEKNQISDSTIAFINSRIDLVSGDLSGIETDIQHFKQTNNIANLDEQSKALIANSGTYYDKLNEVEVQLSVVKTMLDFIKDDKNNNRPVPSLLTADPAFLQLLQQYNGLILQKDRLLLSVNENNPITANLRLQISNLHADLIKSLQNQQKTFEISRSRILAEKKQMGGLVKDVPAQERQYVDLSREQDVKQALYLYLLQKKEETSITKASNLPNATIIEQPAADYLPYFPNKILIGSAGLLLALILPTAFIILKKIFNNKILNREDITSNTKAPILAEIGHNEKEGLLSMSTESRSVIAEQFRVFRTNMDFLTGQKRSPKILITSSITGEGKSFIASNLALVYAYSGKKVLLMEMDLRKPKLSSMLGVSNDTGFSTYIISERPVNEYIRALANVPNVFLLSSGPIPPNPAELLMSEKMPELFAQLEKEFDIIIMDTAPIGLVTDAQLLAKHSDANLYVVRQNYSFKSSIEVANDLLDNERLSNLYIVVNDVKKGSAYRYGYGYGYGYGGYGYGYVEAEKKSKWGWMSKK